MLQQDKPDDYVIATGESHSVREVLEVAFGDARPRLEASTSRSIRATCARPRSTTCTATPSKARAGSAGSRRSRSSELIEMMVRADEEDVRGAIAGRPPRM